MKNKTVLITGAGGFIGSHLTEAVVKKAARVKAMVHYNSRNDYGLIHELDQEVRQDLEIISSDIQDPAAVMTAMKGVDIVFHLAALIGIPYSYHAPNSYVDTNIKGTVNVMNAARELGTEKIVHTSTSEVYGTALYTPINEKHPLQGQSPYSASKIAADKLAESYFLSFDLPVTTIRPFNAFGPRQSLRAVIPTIITQALTTKVIKLGNTDTIRDFNFVKDTVSGYLKIAESQHTSGLVINIGSGHGVTINQVIETVGKILDIDLQIEIDQKRYRPEKSEVYKLISDSTLAADVIGWKPDYTFEEGIMETIQWYKNNIQKFQIDFKQYIL
jgi:dTDP-glucose 4,6-dehydratase